MHQAELFLWDYHAEKKVWQGTLDRTVSVYNALVVGADGRLYGTVKGGKAPDELFVFDPRLKTFIGRITLPEGSALDLGLQNGPDDKIYGFTRSSIYRLDPATLTIEVIVHEKGAFKIAGPILGNDIYFATGHRLRAVKIF